MKKALSTTIAIIAVAFILYECGFFGTPAERAEKRAVETTQKYLNERYDDSFTFLSYAGGSFMQPWDTLTFHSEKYDETINIRYVDGKVFDYNYFNFDMQDDAEHYLEDIVTKYGYKAFVRVDIVGGEYPEGKSKYPSFDECLDARWVVLDAFFISDSPIDESAMETILVDISTNDICGQFYFIVTNNPEPLRVCELKDLYGGNIPEILKLDECYIYRDHETGTYQVKIDGY